MGRSTLRVLYVEFLTVLVTAVRVQWVVAVVLADGHLGWGVGARIQVIDGDAVAELASLWEWLRAEPDLRGHVRMVPALPGGEEMGAVVEVLTVALGYGGAGAVLATSLTTWLRQRRADVTITVSTPEGRTVQLEASRVADPLPLLREVLRDSDGH